MKLRITAGPVHTNILFDLVVPHRFHLSDSQVAADLSTAIKGLSDRYYPVIQVERSYVDYREE